jgi:enoyl-CoA hydratase/carnithine racemase
VRTVNEIADSSVVTGIDLELDETGRPRRPVVVVDAASWAELSPQRLDRAIGVLRRCDPVVILLADAPALPAALSRAADVVLASDASASPDAVVVSDVRGEADRLVGRITGASSAALALTWLLRAGRRMDVAGALAAESAAYSALLAGHDFASWLAARGPARPAGGSARVTVDRDGDVLHIELCRVDRRNAVDAAMREALLDALAIAQSDDRLAVTITAAGPSFCAGGDLDEFGTAADPALAHVIRMSRSVGRVLHELRERVTVRVQGDCIGAGMELPAFAEAVIAAEGSRFRLPEIDMGLIPGAGGTVSVPRRIGRTRALWLALSGDAIDARTALQWGLVDGVE